MSLRDAAKLAQTSHEQIRIAERGEAGEVVVENIRAAYRKHAVRSTAKALAAAIPEKELKALKKSKEKFAPLFLTINFREVDGEIYVEYEGTDPRTEAVGDIVAHAIAQATGGTGNPVH